MARSGQTLDGSTTPRYLYALDGRSGEQCYGHIGIGESEVQTLVVGQIAAVVSELPGGRPRPERRNLAAHQQVLTRLMEDSTPLPVAFGVVVESMQALAKLVSRNQDLFLDQLQRVQGKVEMGLRIRWDVQNIFEFFVDAHSELRELRDRMFRGRREPTHSEKVELGRVFDQLLAQDRVAHSDGVVAVLEPLCHEIKRNAPRNEREVTNLACLVGRDQLQEFEKAVFQAAALFDNNYAFDYNGPWAPHNFVELELEP